MAKKTNQRARFAGGDSANYIRSRTISGYDPSDDENPNEILDRTFDQKHVHRRQRILTVLVIIGALSGLVFLAMTQFAASVGTVEYAQNVAESDREEQYLSFANQYLADHPPERFFWLLRGSEFLAEARNAFPEISKISISNNIISGSRLNLSFRTPVAVWRLGDKRSYVDQDGVAFEKNFFDEPNITISDQSNSAQINGISGRMLEFIGKTIAGIESSGAGKVKEVTIPVSAARYVEFRLIDRDFSVKVQIDRDVSSQITDIVNIIKFLDERAIKPTYVDVRIKNRGFWK
jgi:hypothetical protein